MKTLKNIIIFIVLLGLVGAGVYFGFFKDTNKTTSSALQTTSVVDTNQISLDSTKALSQQFITSLSKIKNINLTTVFFEGSAYKSLQDYTQSIVLQDPSLIGRPNPFAPFDTDVSTVDNNVNLTPEVTTPSENTPVVTPSKNIKKK
ncbi:MAG: hypothetical protein ACR2IQ_00360 [Minisyncoccia bacterium]